MLQYIAVFMMKKIWHSINPLVHLGEKKYSLVIPLLATILIYALSEFFAFFILRQPNSIGTPDVILTLLLVIYFAFRFGLKGGFTVVGLSILFFTYFIVSRHVSLAQKEVATAVATAIIVVSGILALILGWLRQTIDELFSKEKAARVHAEDAEERFHALADNIPNLCWMAKPDGYIYWYNKRWYQYTGTTPKQMEGWGWQSVHDPKILPQVLDQWTTAIKNKQFFEMIFPLKGKDGKYRPFLTRIMPVKNRSGKVIQWFGTNTDISEQIEIQKRKDDFLGMASHELKTPITSMKVYTQLLMKEFQDNPKKKIVLKKVNAQVDKLTALVSEMLDTTRMQQGKLELNNEKFILKDTALEIIDDLQAITDHKVITNWETHEYVYADKERLRQVITNLVTNAIKYSPENKEIIIKSEKKDSSIVVSVQDFGIGIPKDEQAHIFDRFFQVHQNKGDTYPGLGLGLYISKEIITRMGGKMWVESRKGKGSTFFFSLPIYKGK